eukprot:g894.t1
MRSLVHVALALLASPGLASFGNKANLHGAAYDEEELAMYPPGRKMPYRAIKDFAALQATVIEDRRVWVVGFVEKETYEIAGFFQRLQSVLDSGEHGRLQVAVVKWETVKEHAQELGIKASTECPAIRVYSALGVRPWSVHIAAAPGEPNDVWGLAHGIVITLFRNPREEVVAGDGVRVTKIRAFGEVVRVGEDAARKSGYIDYSALPHAKPRKVEAASTEGWRRDVKKGERAAPGAYKAKGRRKEL